MMKIAKEQWAKNEGKLREAIVELAKDEYINYADIVELALCEIFSGAEYGVNCRLSLDLNNIHEIDDGEYQGTLIYLVPFSNHRPSEGEYLVTYVNYGSCSACDTLQCILNDTEQQDEKINQMVTLCRDIIMHTKRLYNYGWHNYEAFDQVEDITED